MTLGGCSRSKPTAPSAFDTGAKTVAQAFFDRLIQQNWHLAYELLDESSKSWCSESRFIVLGKTYFAHLGFAPITVSVSVAESGDRATAIAHFHGSAADPSSNSRDGTELRRSGEKWTVVLRDNFGKVSPQAANQSRRTGKK
jgi:hypothetical protein